MIQVLLAALLWGFAGAFAGRLMGGTLEPHLLVPLRFFGSFLLLWPAFWLFPLDQTEWWRLCSVGLALALTQVTYYAAIQASSVATALFLQYTAPVLLTVYALVKGESFQKSQLFGLGIAVIGAYFLVVGPQRLVGGWQGVFLGLSSAVLFATFSYLTQQVKTHPLTILAIATGLGSILSLPFVSWQQLLSLKATDWFATAYIVLLGTVIPFGLFLWGIQKISARTATLTAMIEPCSGAILAIFVAGQNLQPVAFLGGILILYAVWLNATSKS